MKFKNSGGEWTGRNGSQARRVGNDHGKKPRRRTASLLEQPIAESAGAMPCGLCGHPVDPRRMHFHMVRCHGATFCTKDVVNR